MLALADKARITILHNIAGKKYFKVIAVLSPELNQAVNTKLHYYL